MKENSTEEDIKIINNFITYFNKNIQNGNKADLTVLGEEINALEHILSDYKRVLEMNEVLLKENELLRKDIEGWKKYCKEIEEEQIEKNNKNCELEFEVEKLQKENEELKIKEFQLHLATEEMKSMIYKQKVKDKIEEILKNKEYRIVFEGNAEFPDDATIINAQKYIKLEKMQELIEEREEE